MSWDRWDNLRQAMPQPAPIDLLGGGGGFGGGGATGGYGTGGYGGGYGSGYGDGWGNGGYGGGMGQQNPMGLKLGLNMGTAGALFNGLSTIGGLWSAFQQNKMAKQAQRQSLAFANKNLENSTSAYNAQVENTGRSRAFMEGMSPEQAQSYLDKTRLTFSPVR